MNKALFLDRDGVINIDYGYVHKIKDFELTDWIIEFVKKYQEEGYIIIVVSNQAGIGKKMYGFDDLEKIDSFMKNLFLENGIKISGSYYCPHHPDDNCDCRKPKPGLILKAQKDFDIDLENSVLVGDKMSDLEAGHNAGIKRLFFKKSRYEESVVDFDYERL